MVYKVLIKNELNKILYISADSEKEAKKRLVFQYSVPIDSIEIKQVYEEDGLINLKLVKSYEGITAAEDLVDDSIVKKARELFKNNKRRCEPWKTEYMTKYKMKEVGIESEKDLYSLIKKYKKIKVYWETTEKRGVHKYYALVK